MQLDKLSLETLDSLYKNMDIPVNRDNYVQSLVSMDSLGPFYEQVSSLDPTRIALGHLLCVER